jgi:SHS2 domain-containing protein
MPAPFQILEHPADIGFQAWGRTQAELFENAALALFSLSCELSTVHDTESRPVEVTASDLESLLYAWLAELVAIAEADHFVFRRAVVSFADSSRIRATVYGEPLDRGRHHSGTHIKAVTFHQLHVRETPDGWSAQVFLDL